MRHSITVCALLAVLSFYGCKKDNALPGTSVNHNHFVDSAIQYLKSSLSQNEFEQLDFSKSKALIYQNQNSGVQIFEKGNNDDKFLLLERKNSNYSGNWIDVSGLRKSSSHYKNGSIILNDINNISVTKLVVDDNKVIEMEKTFTNNSNTVKIYFKAGYSTSNASPETETPVLPEVIIYYDVDGAGGGIDYYSWYWLMDQVPSASYDYFTIGGSGGSSSGGYSYSSHIVVAPKFISPDAPIADLSKELKCLTVNSTSTYNISVNVNQPYPGSREVINPLSDFPAGHTFLTLEQHNADGSSVVRSVGFYPKNSVKPGSSRDQSVFGDDTNTPYDVAINFTVTGSEMNKVIGKLLDQRALQYDLNNFNCTNSPMEALKGININLPDTKSMEPLFSGNDPGDLGEDLRSLNLNTFSAQNGNRKITRTVSNYDNQYPKGKAGTCP